MSTLPGVTSADRLFVFAGAGASRAMPAALPLFDPMRDNILGQLRLDGYQPEVTDGLAPEPFMRALRDSGVDIDGWLAETLRNGVPFPPQPNAVHVALAQLARAGAAVWTVNFDTLVEEAGPGLRAISWPAAADGQGEIYKPHGSLPGELIVTADGVLAGLEPGWRAALAAAVRGRTVAFIGYSGRDFDFQPLWDELLTAARDVLWFGVPEPEETERRRRLLRRCSARGAFLPVEAADPSLAFVTWCQDNGLVSIDSALLDRLADDRPHRPFPRLEGDLAQAEVAIRGMVGDWRGAVRVDLRRLRQEPGKKQTAARLTAMIVNNAGRWVTLPLWTAARIPLLPPELRVGAERKRITAHSRLGNHRQVLRGTRHTDDTTLSTLVLLRSQSLRITGNLDEAASTAAEAHRRATAEKKEVRIAHAAYQRAQALLWGSASTSADAVSTRTCGPLPGWPRPVGSPGPTSSRVAWHCTRGTSARPTGTTSLPSGDSPARVSWTAWSACERRD
jgi:hypothetical protein